MADKRAYNNVTVQNFSMTDSPGTITKLEGKQIIKLYVHHASVLHMTKCYLN